MTAVDTVLLMLLALTYKHFVADFLYQPPYQWQNKGTYGHWGGMFHSGQHALLTMVILMLFGVPDATVIILISLEFLLHYHIDWAKMNLNKKMGWTANAHNQFWILLGVDQLLHSLTYIGIVWIAMKHL